MNRSRIVSLLSVLPTPLLVLGSAHELYLRNQRELDGVSGVLVPFWGAAAVAIVMGWVLVALVHRGWARTALWAYHGAGGLFLLYSFLRAMPWNGHFAAWVLDQFPTALGLLGVYAATVAALSGRNLKAIASPLAVFAVALIAQESWRLGSRLSLPPILEDMAPAPTLEEARASLPNVYHLVLDSFEPDVFDRVWPADAPLDGFVYFTRTRSLFFATEPSMASVFSSRRPEHIPYLATALAAPESLPNRLRAAGYRTVAYLPPGVYPPGAGPFDAIVWHSAALSESERASLHRWLFLRLWVATTLPAGVVDRLAAGNLFGLDAEELRSLRNQRMSVLTQPVETLLSFERYLGHEATLPPVGRYTLVHLLVPHNPYVLAADCSHSDLRAKTDVLSQSRCATLVLQRFLDRLDRLGRLRDSVVLIHSDHSSIPTENGAFVAKNGDNPALLLLKPRHGSGTLRRAGEPASLLDVTPTLLQMLGLPASPLHQGRLLPLEGPASP